MSINFYEHVKKKPPAINPYYNEHGLTVPFMMCIASATGTGKSNHCMNLIYLMSKTFHEIILCVKSADEPLYEALCDKLEGRVQVFEGGDVPDLEQYNRLDEKTNKMKRIDNKQRLIIFDDLCTDKKANKKIEQYYIKSRKLGFSCIYISQSFFVIPKLIRDNCKYFLLGRGLLVKDLRLILSCFPTEMTIEQFTKLYNTMTSEDMSCVLIDVDKRTIRRNIKLQDNEIYQL